MVMIVKLSLVLLLVVSTTAAGMTFDRSVKGEQRGVGLTKEEADFIKAKIIETAKIAGDDAQYNAVLLQDSIGAVLGSVWGAIIISEDSDCNLGIRLGEPIDNKWIQIDEFGPYPQYDYIIWKYSQ